jgi:uncharacterized protein (DUF4415 family)
MRKNGRNTMRQAGKAKASAKRAPARRPRTPGRTDWARVDAMTDDDIERLVAADPDASPIWTDEMFASARWVVPKAGKRTQIALKVDPDVLAFYKQPGPGYQTRMNDVLRAYMEQARRARSK